MSLKELCSIVGGAILGGVAAASLGNDTITIALGAFGGGIAGYGQAST